MIDKFDFSHESNLTADILIGRVKGYYSDANFDLLKKAYDFAEKAHRGQKRSSGENYIIHPLNVAATLIKLRMDVDSIIAGLLHDVIEDCGITEEDLEKEFSGTVANIVVGLTKISKIKFKTREENQAENFRKMVVAMAKDIRVIIVKLADRMHNMKTLQYVSISKQKSIARETLDIYVPLAGRLGIHSVKAELEDLCLRFLFPEVYYDLAEKVALRKSERSKYIQEVVEVIKDKLAEYGVKSEVKGRSKHFYSIYRKMKQRGLAFDQIQDILAFRVLVSNITECYKCLGVIHSSFTPIPGRFKDYIAIPKINNYQSLHSTVIGPKNERIEIQIRTFEMNEIAEAGVAAHWKYKEGSKNNQKFDWVEELLEFNYSVQNNSEFLDAVKNDLDIGGVFVFTPKGDVKELKHGSTPLDFAYSIHTEVGNYCVGAKVNGRIVPLKYRLKSGDEIEVLTSSTQSPSKDWLKIVKTSKAKAKIKQWLLKTEKEKSRELGKSIIEKAIRTRFNNAEKNSILEGIKEKLHYKSLDDIYIDIGIGRVTARDLFSEIDKTKVKDPEPSPSASLKDQSGVLVAGNDTFLIRMGKCCNPIPGDSIVGFITRGRGITIHTYICYLKNDNDFERSIPVEWSKKRTGKHPVTIKVLTNDQPGILAEISNVLNSNGINIRSAYAKSLNNKQGSFIFEVEMRDTEELEKIMMIVERLGDVIKVERI